MSTDHKSVDQRLSKPRRYTLSGSIRVFMAESLMLPTGFAIIAILTRWLGAELYGLYVLALAIVGWIQASINSYFTHSSIIVSSGDQNPEGSSRLILRSYLLVGTALGVVLVLASQFVAVFFHEERLTNLLRFLSVDILLFAFARAYQSIWIGRGEFALRASMSFVRWLVRLALVILLVVGGYSLMGAILANIGATLAEAAYAFSKRPINPLNVSTRASKEVFSVIRPLALFVLAMRLFSILDLLSLRVLGISLHEVGLYGAARNLAVIPGIFSLSISPLLLSTLNKNVTHGELATSQLVSKDALRLALGLFPFAGIIAGSSQDFVVFILGSDFSGSSPLFNFLIFGAVFQTYFSISSAILLAAKRYRQVAFLGFCLLALSFLFYPLLIPRYGPSAAAWVITALSILASITGYFLIRHAWNVYPPRATLMRSVLFSVVGLALSVILKTSGMFILVELGLLSIAVVSGFVISGELSTSEKSRIKQFFADASKLVIQK